MYYICFLQYYFIVGLVFPLQDPPEITSHPSSTKVLEGEDTSLMVETSGHPVSYQWMKDSQPLSDGEHFSGTRTHTLSLRNMDSTLNGVYACVVDKEIWSHKAQVTCGECAILSTLSLWTKHLVLVVRIAMRMPT